MLINQAVGESLCLDSVASTWIWEQTAATKEAERRTPASCLPPLYGAESGRKVGWSLPSLSFLPAGEPKRFAVIAAECQRELKEGDKNVGPPAGSPIGSQQPLGNRDWVTIDSSLREELRVLP